MGSPDNERGRYKDEGPVRKVTIKKPFYLGTYLVTQGEWKEVMKNNPSYFKGDDLPVENVSWNDAQEFIKELNKNSNDEYRLPTEAEWEYAAKAGTTTRYSFGNDESELDKYAWYDENAGDKTHPVGKKEANPWGLYDMHGNVWEWVQDELHGNYKGAPTNGNAWEDGNDAIRMNRGGSWFNNARYCRSAIRHYGPGYRYRSRYLGFRLVKIIK